MASGNDFGGADTAAAFGGNAPSGFGGTGFDAGRGISSPSDVAASFQNREAALMAQMTAIQEAQRAKEAKAVKAFQDKFFPAGIKDVGVAPGVKFATNNLNEEMATDYFDIDVGDARNEPTFTTDDLNNLFINTRGVAPDVGETKKTDQGLVTGPTPQQVADWTNPNSPEVGTERSLLDELTGKDNNRVEKIGTNSTLADAITGGAKGFLTGGPFGALGGGDDGNYQAIKKFLAAPTYSNIPTNNVDYGRGLSALEQALLGIDDTVSNRGFEGLGYAESGRNRARDIFDTFGEGDSIDDLLNFGVGQQFGTDALTDTQNRYRTGYTDTANQRFGNDFQLNLIDPDAFSTTVDNILGDRRDSASRIIGNAGARGNLSTLGQSTANQSLGTQEAGARDRLTGIARGVESQGQQGLTGIADEARGGASGFTLGDSAFDITPFSDRATSYRSDTSGSFGSDVDAALGSDPLFDTGTALSTAAGSQGAVSGTPSFLDTIATRQGSGASSRDRRGLGSRGSGQF